MPFWTKEDHIKLDKKNMIGRGAFSRVYKISDSEVIILTNDTVKECLSYFCQGEHIPEMERLENVGDYQAYKMPLYSKLTSKHTAAWKQYQELKKLFQCKAFKKYECFEKIGQLVLSSGLSEELKESLLSISDNMANYTREIFFDVFPRNFMVDTQGKLILTDICCDVEKLEEVRNTQEKKRQNKRWERHYANI